MPILAAKADMIKHRIYFYMLIYMGEKTNNLEHGHIELDV